MTSEHHEVDLQLKLKELLAISSIEEMTPREAVHTIGALIDLGSDLSDATAPRAALKHLESIRDVKLPGMFGLETQYLEANAWLLIDQLEHREGSEEIWAWDREEIEKALISFRRATQATEFDDHADERRSRILTNLANTLNTLGRFVASNSIYREAAAAVPSFGMPRVNRGIALWEHAKAHYDHGHSGILLWHAHQEMLAALQMPLESGAEEYAQQHISYFYKAASKNFLEMPLNLDDFSLGASDEEICYRKWCLSQRLFLNSLNDCLEHPIAATDVLHLPSIVRSCDDGPGLHGFFNQLKQQYVSARFNLYEALHETDAHFSDKDVKLVNTGDYPVYGLAAEKIRGAFRSAASILDQVAVFLARYMELPNSTRTTFRTLWYRRGKPKQGLRQQFQHMKNWPLRGLFWLSKDFYNTAICGELVDPEGVRLKDIRNHLEHNYVKVVEFLPDDELPSLLKDEEALLVTRDDFSELALRYLAHAREALIYLSLGVHSDQRQKAEESDDKYTPPVFLDDLEDEWKA